MGKKPGPRKKPGERYPSGDLKPIIAPALWGRARDHGGPQLSSELTRLRLHRELTEAQAAAGFVIADIYNRSDSAEAAKEGGDAPAVDIAGNPHPAQTDRKALDALLLEYPPKVRKAVIELCVFNRAVDWKLRPEIRQVLGDVALLWKDALRRQAASQSKLARGSGAPWTSDRTRASRRIRPGSSQISDAVELGPDFDPNVEAFRKMIAVLQPALDAAGRDRVVNNFVALRDREEFRQEKAMQDTEGRRQS
jgi:hypothetical protein